MIGMAVLLMAGSCALMAQEKIDRIADELEAQGVDVSKVVNRDPKTRKVVSVIRSFEFRSKNGTYAKRLLKAFDEEAPNAVTETSDLEDDEEERTLIFKKGDKTMIYSIEVERNKPNPEVELNIIIKSGKVGAVINGLLDSLSEMLPDSMLLNLDRHLDLND